MLAKKAVNPTDKHVGAKVRLRRAQLGMSQEKLGDTLGITFQQVQKYEKGTNRISASRLQHIALALKVPAAWFFDGLPNQTGAVTNGAPSTVAFDEFATLPHAPALMQDYSVLSNYQRDVVARVARALVEGLS